MTEKNEIIDVPSGELVKRKEKHKYFKLKYKESVNDFKKKTVFG